MLKDALRFAGQVAGLPASAAVRVLNRAVAGRVVLDLEVKRLPDALSRQAVVRRLRRAASDPGVRGVVFRLTAPPGGWAACQDLRQAISRLRAGGKHTWALVESPGHALLWLASACDEVVMVPSGDVMFTGVGAELTFVGAAMERLGLSADLEAAGAYKSFGETFTRTYASPANQEAMEHLVTDLHSQLLADVARDRGLEEAEVVALLHRALLSAGEAMDAGLVDRLAYADELDATLEEEGSLSPFAGWARRDAIQEWVERWGEGGRTVAVVHLEGSIVLEDKRRSVAIKARKVVPVLQQLRKSDDVAAVVLHVNSGGGSALASDLIWREVELLGRAKPVVAAFETVAASGGYYLSAPAAEIVARPGTLTGSIGVFGGKLVAREAMRKAGVHSQAVTAAPHAHIFSATRPFSDHERVRFRAMLDRSYDQFVQRVASGRRRLPEAVEPHCRGRVWTGRSAREHGLVDSFGDLEHAVDRASALASLRTYRRRDLTPSHSRTLLTRAMATVREGTSSRALLLADLLLDRTLGPVAEVLLDHPEQVLALMPFDIEIK